MCVFGFKMCCCEHVVLNNNVHFHFLVLSILHKTGTLVLLLSQDKDEESGVDSV